MIHSSAPSFLASDARSHDTLALVLSGVILFRDTPGVEVSVTVIGPVAVVVGAAVVLAGRLAYAPPSPKAPNDHHRRSNRRRLSRRPCAAPARRRRVLRSDLSRRQQAPTEPQRRCSPVHPARGQALATPLFAVLVRFSGSRRVPIHCRPGFPARREQRDQGPQRAPHRRSLSWAGRCVGAPAVLCASRCPPSTVRDWSAGKSGRRLLLTTRQES